ncbi:MAG: DUF1572 domain-containing protein, partial [Bacteroidota bacterium]
MKQSEFLATRIREVHHHGQWVANTNYQKLLGEITWTQATHKLGSLNTIAALTFHVNYFLDGLYKAFSGGPKVVDEKYSFDMSPITSQSEWEGLVDDLLTNAEKFARRVAEFPDKFLFGPFP